MYLCRRFKEQMKRPSRRKPFFVQNILSMEFKAQIEQLLNDFLKEREDLYLIDLKISTADEVSVILDGDQGVTLQDCLDASRAIEFNMDREEHDFSLQVASAGLSEPLTRLRQYQKNVGRDLKLILTDSTELEGELLRVEDERIVLMLRYRKPKEVGKGKVDVEEEREVLIADIKKATVVLKF